MLEKVNYTEKFFPDDEREVLINPLNIFEIVKWNEDRKYLHLRFAPHLDILEKQASEGN